MDQAPLLRFEKVGKAYFSNQVLRNVTFNLEKGHVLGLVGENGAGKSTLMHILIAMQVIQETGGYEGQVFIDGQEVLLKSPKDAFNAGIGLVTQEPCLVSNFTVTENIVLNRESLKYNPLVEAFGHRWATLDRGGMENRATIALSKLNVDLRRDVSISGLPIWQKKITQIAREIDKQDVRILIMDEPTTSLTESEAEILLKSMRYLANKGIAIIFITDRLQEIMRVCDDIVILRDGEVVLQTTPAQTSIREITGCILGHKISVQTEETSKDRKIGSPILEVKNLWVDMPGETVRNVSFQAYKGEILGMGGLAGQGKLGITKGIMGLHVAGGLVVFDGNKLTLNHPASPLKSGISAVFEDRNKVGLFLELSISWNISFAAIQKQNKFLKSYLGGLVKIRQKQAISECVNKYIRDLGIKCTSENQAVGELSGGNQQKVCLAKAFVTNPELLFVVEPTQGIDVGAKRVVLDTLKKINREQGMTIVMISSELEDLRATCDRIAIVDKGRIVGVKLATESSEVFTNMMIGMEA